MTEATIRKAERRAKAIDLLGGECKWCGSLDRLAFDHINNDRDSAKDMLAYRLRGNWERVLIELQKCQLLCIRCHMRKTHIDHGHSAIAVHGSLGYYTNNRCRCYNCKEANTLRMRQYRLQHG